MRYFSFPLQETAEDVRGVGWETAETLCCVLLLLWPGFVRWQRGGDPLNPLLTPLSWRRVKWKEH